MLLPAYLPWLHTWKYYFEKSRKPRFKSDIIRHLKSKDHCLPSSCLFLHYQQCEYGPNRPAKRNNPLSHRNFHRELCVNEYRIAHLQSPSQGQHLFFSKTIFPAIPALFSVPISIHASHCNLSTTKNRYPDACTAPGYRFKTFYPIIMRSIYFP